MSGCLAGTSGQKNLQDTAGETVGEISLKHFFVFPEILITSISQKMPNCTNTWCCLTPTIMGERFQKYPAMRETQLKDDAFRKCSAPDNQATRPFCVCWNFFWTLESKKLCHENQSTYKVHHSFSGCMGVQHLFVVQKYFTNNGQTLRQRFGDECSAYQMPQSLKQNIIPHSFWTRPDKDGSLRPLESFVTTAHTQNWHSNRDFPPERRAWSMSLCLVPCFCVAVMKASKRA